MCDRMFCSSCCSKKKRKVEGSLDKQLMCKRCAGTDGAHVSLIERLLQKIHKMEIDREETIQKMKQIEAERMKTEHEETKKEVKEIREHILTEDPKKFAELSLRWKESTEKAVFKRKNEDLVGENKKMQEKIEALEEKLATANGGGVNDIQCLCVKYVHNS